MKFNKGDLKAIGLVGIITGAVAGTSWLVSRAIDYNRYSSLPSRIQYYDLNRNGVLEMNEAKAFLDSSLHVLGEVISSGGTPLAGFGATPTYREPVDSKNK